MELNMIKLNIYNNKFINIYLKMLDIELPWSDPFSFFFSDSAHNLNKSFDLSNTSEIIFKIAKAKRLLLSLSVSSNFSKKLSLTFLHSKKSSYYPISLLSMIWYKISDNTNFAIHVRIIKRLTKTPKIVWQLLFLNLYQSFL